MWVWEKLSLIPMPEYIFTPIDFYAALIAGGIAGGFAIFYTGKAIANFWRKFDERSENTQNPQIKYRIFADNDYCRYEKCCKDSFVKNRRK